MAEIKITFYVDDDIKTSSELVEVEINSCFDPPTKPDSLKSFRRSIALLRGHYKSCEISDIKTTAAKSNKNNVYADYQVRKFAERVLEFAKRNGNGYATSLHDLEEHIYFLLGGRANENHEM